MSGLTNNFLQLLLTGFCVHIYKRRVRNLIHVPVQLVRKRTHPPCMHIAPARI